MTFHINTQKKAPLVRFFLFTFAFTFTFTLISLRLRCNPSAACSPRRGACTDEERRSTTRLLIKLCGNQPLRGCCSDDALRSVFIHSHASMIRLMGRRACCSRSSSIAILASSSTFSIS